MGRTDLLERPTQADQRAPSVDDLWGCDGVGVARLRPPIEIDVAGDDGDLQDAVAIGIETGGLDIEDGESGGWWRCDEPTLGRGCDMTGCDGTGHDVPDSERAHSGSSAFSAPCGRGSRSVPPR